MSGTEVLKSRPIVNWYGITDVVDLLDGPNSGPFAVQWLGAQPDRVDDREARVAADLRSRAICRRS